MGATLERVSIKGFKSIADQEIQFGSVNVLIGPNGAGKSNLIAFFRMLSHMLASPDGNLRMFVGMSGGANTLLFDGAKRTPQLEASLSIRTERGLNDYAFRLVHVSGDAFLFADEQCRFSRDDLPSQAAWISLGAGHAESQMLLDNHGTRQTTVQTIKFLLRRLIVYQFHDTSARARIRQKWRIDDSRYLKEDAGNLGAFLLRLQEEQPAFFKRIVEVIRQVVPFVDRLILEPEYGHVLLRWRERGSDQEFGVHQASDGMLRAIALITLLLQPPEQLPGLLALDEPELGLHPYAMTIVAGLIKAAAVHCQIVIATQSPAFLDQFSIEDIIVVDRMGRDTQFHRLGEEALQEWMDAYRLSDLWEMNILGGRPKEIAA